LIVDIEDLLLQHFVFVLQIPPFGFFVFDLVGGDLVHDLRAILETFLGQLLLFGVDLFLLLAVFTQLLFVLGALLLDVAEHELHLVLFLALAFLDKHLAVERVLLFLLEFLLAVVALLLLLLALHAQLVQLFDEVGLFLLLLKQFALLLLLGFLAGVFLEFHLL